MNIDPIGFLPPLQDIPLLDSTGRAGTSDFASWMSKELGSLNDKVTSSEHLLQQLATGEVDNLHQVMLKLDEAKLSFQLMVQVRNKLLEAYQDILRMQV
jgi:flagellar hook-basal body complex protein FliE